MLLSIYFCHVSNSVQTGCPSMEKSLCSHRNGSYVSARQKRIFLSNTVVMVNLFSANSGGAQLAIESNKRTPVSRKLLCWLQGKEGHLKRSGMEVSNGTNNWLHWLGQSSGFLKALIRIFPIVFKVNFWVWGLSSSVFLVLAEISVF